MELRAPRRNECSRKNSSQQSPKLRKTKNCRFKENKLLNKLNTKKAIRCVCGGNHYCSHCKYPQVWTPFCTISHHDNANYTCSEMPMMQSPNSYCLWQTKPYEGTLLYPPYYLTFHQERHRHVAYLTTTHVSSWQSQPLQLKICLWQLLSVITYFEKHQEMGCEIKQLPSLLYFDKRS